MKRVAKKWIRTPSDEQAVKEGCYVDLQAADRVCQFIERFLRHSDGQFAGQPFSLLPWQRDLLIRLYGWKRADSSRRFRLAYISVSKKQGKTNLLAALSIYHTLADGEPGAQVLNAAIDRQQASYCFDAAVNQIRSSPELSNLEQRGSLEIVGSQKRIVFLPTKSYYKALSADVGSKEGLNASFICIDELHVQKSPELFRTLRYAGAARRQPLMVCITTAGVDKQSICYEQYRYAKQVESGAIIDTTFFSCIFEADPADEIDDPKTWLKANPSLGQTIKAEDFKKELNEARESVTGLNEFLRYRLNIWTDAFSTWIPDDKIKLCQQEFLESELEGQTCYAGLDLSSTVDTTALALLFPYADGFRLLTRIWLPGENVRHCETRDRAPYRTWSKAGHLTLTGEDAIDYEAIRAEINALGKRFKIKQIATDDWNAVQLSQQLTSDGFDVVSFGQGFKYMNAPTKELERLILGGKLHFVSPVFRWMLGNVALETDSHGNYRPSKRRSASRIDAIIACCQSLGIAPTLRPAESKANPYETASLFA